MDVNAWGAKFKNLRTALDLTQAELGKMLGLSQVTVANYEQGKRFPKYDTLLDIARIFSVSLDILINPNANSSPSSHFPPGFLFGLDQLIAILLNKPLEDAITYTASWKQQEKLGLAAFFETVLIPVLVKTGEDWFQGDILISEEHLISAKVRELIFFHSNRESEHTAAFPDTAWRWMGFCAPGEKHELALLMLAHILRLEGWHTVYLGTQLPFNDLLEAIGKYKPDVLGISITMEENVAGLELYIKQIEEKFGGKPAIILGGQGAALIDTSRFAAVYAGAKTLMEGVRLAAQVLINNKA